MGFGSGAIKNMTHASDRPLNGLTTSSRPRCLCRLCYKRRHTRQNTHHGTSCHYKSGRSYHYEFDARRLLRGAAKGY